MKDQLFGGIMLFGKKDDYSKKIENLIKLLEKYNSNYFKENSFEYILFRYGSHFILIINDSSGLDISKISYEKDTNYTDVLYFSVDELNENKDIYRRLLRDIHRTLK